MKNKYQAVLISPDGQDYVTDFGNSESIDLVWQSINNMGSKWFFYPICFVIKDTGNHYKPILEKQRIADSPDSLIKDGIDLRGKSIKSAMQWIADNKPYIEMILS
ncbi:MAG: hypothetical protein WC516_09790 [Patescibacteria group bacterium]|jgi:hypothetical protein